MHISTRTAVLSVILYLASKTHSVITPSCPPNLYIHQLADNTFQCCRYCPPGTHVRSHCNNGNVSSCQECPYQHFYEEQNKNTGCYRCSECSELMVMKFPCTTTTDTICVCKEEHYYRSLFRTCTKCSTCKVGYGVVQDCSHSTKRVCQQCFKGETFTNKENTKCRKCSYCGINEFKVANCTTTQDTICREVARQPEKSMTLVIVLVAVTLVILIVSLIACALSRKMRPRCLSRDASASNGESERKPSPSTSTGGASQSSVEQTPLRVDIPAKDLSSGGPSLSSEEQTPLRTENPSRDLSLDKVLDIRKLPYDVLEELAKLLDPKIYFGKNWKSLAGLLKYTQIEIENLSRPGDSPTLQLLCDCSSQMSCSVQQLYQLFKRMRREDCAALLEPYLNSSDTAE